VGPKAGEAMIIHRDARGVMAIRQVANAHLASPQGGIPDRQHLRLIEWGQATEGNGMTIRRAVLDG
jgi:hypothetical protein